VGNSSAFKRERRENTKINTKRRRTTNHLNREKQSKRVLKYLRRSAEIEKALTIVLLVGKKGRNSSGELRLE